METIRAFIRILFPVAQNLRFIASLFTIWEQIGFSTIESLRSLVRVLGCMIPTLALRNIPNIGSFQGVVDFFARTIMCRTRLIVTEELFIRDTAVPI